MLVQESGQIKEPGLTQNEVLIFIRCIHIHDLTGLSQDGQTVLPDPSTLPFLLRASQRQEVPTVYRAATYQSPIL